ncbi:MAG TPA: hypothetical protein PLN64_03795 [Candidatus Bipolaricaulis anaerobius]|nr:hypothetical protein [Candidatus Bipolaricaulis anaerobius]
MEVAPPVEALRRPAEGEHRLQVMDPHPRRLHLRRQRCQTGEQLTKQALGIVEDHRVLERVVVEVEGRALHRRELAPRPEVELVVHPPRWPIFDCEHVPLLQPGSLIGLILHRDLEVVIGDPVPERSARRADEVHPDHPRPPYVPLRKLPCVLHGRILPKKGGRRDRPEARGRAWIPDPQAPAQP